MKELRVMSNISAIQFFSGSQSNGVAVVQGVFGSK
jgi:hypothetical protein